MMKMTTLELQAEATRWLKENFDLNMEIPIKINTRLQRSLGRFKWMKYRNGRREPNCIEISSKLLTYHEKETILDVLYHELIHYALFTLGKPHQDGDRFFEETLKIFGVTRTGVIEIKGKVHEYKCSCKTFTNRRRLDLSKGYYCKKCQHNLTYLGEKIV